jgi:hypothetical protein
MAKTKTSGPVTLTPAQQALHGEIEKELSDLMARIDAHARIKPDEVRSLGKKAADLHKSLKDAGTIVRHHKYMIENRGIKLDDPGFYEHVHPIQDLLKFIQNQAANDDPEDQTIDHDFEFSVFSRRWNHDDSYQVKRTKSGWAFTHMMGPITTAKDGRVAGKAESGLFGMLDHDSINYPEELPGYLDWLWERAAEDGLTHEEVQDGLTTLANWVSLVEKNSPAGIFKSFK